MNQHSNLSQNSLLRIMLANLASWCKHQSKQAIKCWSDSIQHAFEYIMIPDSQSDLMEPALPELLVFIEPKPSETLFQQQIDAARGIRLQSVDLPTLPNESALNRPGHAYPSSSSCCRVFMQAADLQLRKVLASNRFHKAKSWQMLSHQCFQQNPVQTRSTQGSTEDVYMATLKQAGPSAFLVVRVEKSGHILEITNQHELPADLASEPWWPISPRNSNSIGTVGRQSANRESVEHLVARIDGKTVGCLSLNFCPCQKTTHTAATGASSSPDQFLKRSDYSVGIFDLFIELEFRRQGIGSRLVQAAIEYCSGLSVMHLGLLCAPELQRFYERLGFTMVGAIDEWARID